MTPTVIRKSIAGLLVIALKGLAGFAVVAFLALYLTQFNPIWGMALGFLAVVIMILTMVAAVVYSRCFLSYNDTQLTVYDQLALFGATTNSCDFADLEDVIVNRGGIFAYIFNFGTLRIQTAGARPNFAFTYCPNPQPVRQRLLELASVTDNRVP